VSQTGPRRAPSLGAAPSHPGPERRPDELACRSETSRRVGLRLRKALLRAQFLHKRFHHEADAVVHQIRRFPPRLDGEAMLLAEVLAESLDACVGEVEPGLLHRVSEGLEGVHLEGRFRGPVSEALRDLTLVVVESRPIARIIDELAQAPELGDSLLPAGQRFPCIQPDDVLDSLQGALAEVGADDVPLPSSTRNSSWRCPQITRMKYSPIAWCWPLYPSGLVIRPAGIP